MHTREDWSTSVADVLARQDVRLVTYVPDAGHTDLIELCRSHTAMTTVSLTTEEEGIALLSGAWLGGMRGVLLMQSSGLGNCVNMLSLPGVCQIPLVMLITMRGEWAEFNPWQIPMGQNTPEILKLCNVLTFTVDEADELAETVNAAATMSFEGNALTAVLISQRLLGAKTFGK